MRKFDSGATRDDCDSKIDYDGFFSPFALKAFGEYMHKHRIQSDGSIRASENWRKGIPREVYRKSAFRHFIDWWTKHLAGEDCQEAACATLFNLMGDLHESVKEKLGIDEFGKRIKRKKS